MPPVNLALLQTKLHRPRITRDLVLRPRLLERLNHGLDGRLTLVCAPAGFGKTTLICSWLERVANGQALGYTSIPSAWLSLDENDSDLSLFLRYCIAALRTILTDACPETLTLLKARHPPPQNVIYTTLSNEIEQLPGHFILVLDDYHSIRGEAVHNLLNALVDHWPHPMHLVLISRISPPLPLASLRARDKLTEIRTQDLRFTEAETNTYLERALDKPLSQPAVAMLEERTEGWIAGLRLANLSLGSTSETEPILASLSGAETNIASYLADEVLSRQLPAIQSFLLRTSILDRFCTPLCGAILGESDPAWDVPACIDWLERAELFIIPLDNQQLWYRYHHLFQDLLQQRLQTGFGKEMVADLHRKAAAWFANEGMLDEGLLHALRANDIDLVARLMLQELREALNHEDRPALDRWLRLLPDAHLQRRPELLMIKLWALEFSGHIGKMSKLLDQVEALVEADGGASLSPDQIQLLRGQILVLRANEAFFNNQFTFSLTCSQEALRLVPPSWMYLRGVTMEMWGMAMQASGQGQVARRMLLDEYESLSDKTDIYALRLLFALCYIYFKDSDLEQMRQSAALMLRQATRGVMPLIQGWAHLYLATAYYHWNDLAPAAEHFAALMDLRYITQAIAARNGMAGLALVSQAAGDDSQAKRALETLAQYDLEIKGYEDDDSRSLRARVMLLQGDQESAFRWADAYTLPVPDVPVMWVEEPQVTRARILIARGTPADLQTALQILDTLYDIVERTHNALIKPELLILRALALDAQGETGLALNALAQAVDLSQPGGLIRVFIDKGSHVQELLCQLARSGYSGPSIRRIVNAFPHSAPLKVDLIEPLTPRELDVLRLMAEPLSTKEIARQLYLSPSTVKRHSINLYAKLCVNSRWDAVAKARELGILPPR